MGLTSESKTSREYLSTTVSVLVIIQVIGTCFITSFSNGILAVGLPSIAKDVGLQRDMLLWPSSIGYLATGTFILLAGAISDVVGPKLVNLVGCLSLTAATLAIGLSRNGTELIMFRAWQGLAFGLAYPSSTSIVSLHVRPGPSRNIGFACIGFAMVSGFASGLFVAAVGWREGHYAGAAAGAVMLVLGTLALPSDSRTLAQAPSLNSLIWNVDWVGAAIGGLFLALISVPLSMMSSNAKSIKSPLSICMLVVALLLMPAFALWMRQREACKLPPLIPNSIWTTNIAFTCICFMVLVAGAVQNCMEILCSLFFQEVQHVSALGTSLRILPTSILGGILNLVTGTLVHLAPPVYPATITTIASSVSPLIMVFVNPAWSYWYAEFWGVLLSSLSGDVIFTIGLLIAADAFPEHCQGLAGAVFNVFYFLGASIGLAISDILLAQGKVPKSIDEPESPDLSGFHASFWTLFSLAIASAIIGGVGMRKLSRIGQSPVEQSLDGAVPICPRRPSH